MIYPSETLAQRRIFYLARQLGIWPGYFYSPIGRGWVLTYDPRPETRPDYEGSVLI